MGFSILLSRALRSSSSRLPFPHPTNPFFRPIASTPHLHSPEPAAATPPPESVKDIYDKIHKSIAEIRTCPPNAWFLSMIGSCSNVDEIKLLFDTLQKLRVFRLANLQIHSNFNKSCCEEITKACVKVGAIDYAKIALWKHNIYGLTPSIGSAHQLLLHARKHKDFELAEDVMKLLRKNDVPLQPGTSELIFSIWNDAEDWNSMSKYGKKFIEAKVKLRQNAFDIWMRFAAKRGDVNSLWKIEKFRSKLGKSHSVATGFSCAKGFILEGKPENAAAIIQVVNQSSSDIKRPWVIIELQRLISEWPLEVLKYQGEENKKALAASLQKNIAAMIEHLPRMGVEVDIKMEDLTKLEGLFS